MISTITQWFHPLLSFLRLPWTILDKVADIVRTTLSMNGYTALNPDGVFTEEKEVDDDKGSDSAEEEGESKEEDG